MSLSTSEKNDDEKYVASSIEESDAGSFQRNMEFGLIGGLDPPRFPLPRRLTSACERNSRLFYCCVSFTCLSPLKIC